MLNTKQRAKLMSYSNGIPDIVSVGINGVTPIVIKNTCDNLLAHELIKVKVQKGCEQDITQVAQILADKCDCSVVHIVGSKIILYKYSTKKGIKHYEI